MAPSRLAKSGKSRTPIHNTATDDDSFIDPLASIDFDPSFWAGSVARALIISEAQRLTPQDPGLVEEILDHSTVESARAWNKLVAAVEDALYKEAERSKRREKNRARVMKWKARFGMPLAYILEGLDFLRQMAVALWKSESKCKTAGAQ